MKLVSDTKVRFVTSSTPGAPNLGPDWGSLNNLLKTVLVDGLPASEARVVSYDSSKRQLTISNGDSFPVNHVVEISGHSNPKVNTQFRVVLKNGGQAILQAKEDLGSVDSSVVSVKVPALGWTLAYDDASTTGVRCYKNGNTNFPAILKVVDKMPDNGYGGNWARFAGIVGGREIDGEGNFLNNVKFPYISGHPNAEMVGNPATGTGVNGTFRGIAKWYYTTGNSNPETTAINPSHYPCRWYILGDADTFYFWLDPRGNSVNVFEPAFYGFGLYDDIGLGKGLFLSASDNWMQASNNENTRGWRNNLGFFSNSMLLGFFLGQYVSGEVPTTPYRGFLTGYSAFGTKPSRHFTYQTVNPVSGTMFIDKPLIIGGDAETALKGTLRGVKVPYGFDGFLQGGGFQGHIAARIHTYSDTSGLTTLLLDLEDWD